MAARACAVAAIAFCIAPPAIARAAQEARAQETPAKASARPPAAAQDESTGIVGRARAALAGLHARGLYPEIGTIVPGSGLAFGMSGRDAHLGDSGIGAEVAAMWSLRGYQLYTAQVGLVADRRDMFELEPADANLADLFADRAARKAGLAAYVEVRYRDHPRMDFFGVGSRAADTRTDYGVDGTSVDLVVQWQRSPELGLSGRVGIIDLTLSPGSNDGVPNLPELFLAESTAPGLTRQPRYVATGLSASYDRRDKPGAPASGVFIGGAFRQYSSQDAGTRSFSRAAIDARVYRPVSGHRHVVAGRVLVSTDWTTQTSPTPFYLQYSLGGSRVLRGFPNYRFRGEALLSWSVEYRWHAWKFIEIAPFIDAGHVGERLRDLSRGPVHLSPGVGLRLRSEDRLFFRIDWARSAEGHRLVFAFRPAF